MSGIAIWAKVSDDVHGHIQEQVRAGVFPVRLQRTDWASGDNIWLLDVIAPSRELATSVLANFGKIAGDGQVYIHPMAQSQVDKPALDNIRATSSVWPAKHGDGNG